LLTTPGAKNHGGLGDLATRYVDVESLPWEATRFEGIEFKTLMVEPGGMLTTLVRMAPGAVLPDHEHVEIEQTWVIEGSLKDDEGEVTAGDFCWRPGGSRHTAWSPNGALLLSFFTKPNIFYDKEDAPRGFDT